MRLRVCGGVGAINEGGGGGAPLSREGGGGASAPNAPPMGTPLDTAICEGKSILKISTIFFLCVLVAQKWYVYSHLNQIDEVRTLSFRASMINNTINTTVYLRHSQTKILAYCAHVRERVTYYTNK